MPLSNGKEVEKKARRPNNRVKGFQMHNHLSDIEGIRVGHAQDERLASGVHGHPVRETAIASVLRARRRAGLA